MADRLDVYQCGECEIVMFEVDEESDIEIGDLLWIESGVVKPASMVEDQLSEAANQEFFHDRFAGIAMGKSVAGETDPIQVATTGVFLLDSDTGGAWTVGDYLAPDENSAGTALLDQTLTRVATPERAIGKAYKAKLSGGTRGFIRIVSTVMHGGVQSIV